MLINAPIICSGKLLVESRFVQNFIMKTLSAQDGVQPRGLS